MKGPIKSFISFSRTERMGLIGLLALLIILLTVRTTMHYWVKPDTDVAKEKELVTAWEKFKKEHTDSTSVKSLHNTNTSDSIPSDK